MSEEHTPTPWAIKENNLGCKEIVHLRKGETEYDSFFTAIGYTHGLACEAQDKANAEFIVRACNSHETLIEACKNLTACVCRNQKLLKQYGDKYSAILTANVQAWTEAKAAIEEAERK